MLVINGRFLTLPGGGVRRYALELSQALCAVDTEVLMMAPPDAPDVPGIPLQRSGIFRGHLWEQTELPRFLKKLGSPLLINPANTGPLFYSRNVVILHDMAWHHREKAFSPILHQGYRYLIPALLKHASCVGSVSAFSASEIEQVFPWLKNKVFVVPPSLEYLASWKPAVPKVLSRFENEEFYLAVGLTAERKDAPTLFRAFALRPDMKLIVAGYRAEIVEKVPHLPTNVLLLPKVTDAELAWLYTCCRALISASRYEGFDLPPLETAWFGRPSLLSDIPVHREIWGDKAYYFQTGDAEDLAMKLESVSASSGVAFQEMARSFDRNRMVQIFWEGLRRAGISFP